MLEINKKKQTTKALSLKATNICTYLYRTQVTLESKICYYSDNYQHKISTAMKAVTDLKVDLTKFLKITYHYHLHLLLYFSINNLKVYLLKYFYKN